MPNGVMTGNGSRSNPWIVEDGYDFNAIRNLPHASAADVGFIELGADINLAMYESFVPIVGRFLNIDGKGHKITDISIATSNANGGLFATLNSVEYIKNIVLEGVVHHNLTTTGINDVGMLATNISAAGNNSRLMIENVEIYGSIESIIANTSATGVTSIGGFCGQITPNNNSVIMSKCSFKGRIQTTLLNTSNTAGLNARIGGLVGQVNFSFNPVVTFDACIAEIELFVGGSNGLRTGTYGGMLGDCAGPTNTSNLRTITFLNCLSRLAVNFINTAAFNRNMIFSALMGNNPTSAAVSGIAVNIVRCACFLDINYDPGVPLTGRLEFNGFYGQGTRLATVSPSYAVIKYNNPNDTELSDDFFINGLGHVASAANVFFDETVLRETWDGAIGQADQGRTTAELHSAAFLASQGWVI